MREIEVLCCRRPDAVRSAAKHQLQQAFESEPRYRRRALEDDDLEPSWVLLRD